MNSDIKSLMITEDNFTHVMHKTIEPWVDSEFTKGHFMSYDGASIAYYYIINPDEKASIVISHGFCEFFPKYYELAYIFYNMGYSVFFIEHRGHGMSHRDALDIDLVHIDSYSQYVEDLHEFVEHIVIPESKSKKYVLFAHSMGGCIATLFLEKYGDFFRCAILSSPMHKMILGRFKPWQVIAVGRALKVVGRDNKLASGQKRFDGVNIWQQSSSMSKARYDFQFDKRLNIEEYTTYGSSFAWARESLKATEKCLKDASDIKTPILLCEAGLDTLVDNEGHRIFVDKTDNTTYKIFPKSKHEIFNATDDIREEYYKTVFSYIEEHITV